MREKKVQPQAIIKMIRDFCKAYENNDAGFIPGYCFEHIVLGDYNLYDSNIDFCLEKERVAEWIDDKIKDARRASGERIWQMLGVYSEIIDYAYSAVVFLNKLKEIPESKREAAMEWYQGYEPEIHPGEY